jgi:parallel beta-helix repeat protein
MPSFRFLFSRRPSPARRVPKRPSPRLTLERLEDRLAPAAHIGGNSYATIQDAVNAANAGAVITVDPGSYAEKVTVNKSVTIEGAQHGIAGQASSRTNPANESIVTGASGSTAFYITASNVTIDGFTIEDATNPNNFGFGILIAGGVSGTHIQNNIIQNNIVGIGLANGSGGQTVIQDNLIQNNNQPGPGSGTGIYSDQFVANGSLQNVLIQNNVISGNNNAGIGLSSTDSTEPASTILITGNTLDSNGRGIYLFSTVSSTISGNTITNSTVPTYGGTSVAIGLFGNDNNVSITNNLLAGGAGYGVLIDNASNTAPNSNILLNDNSIAGFATAGLHLNTNSYSGILNASGNYWGAVTGPTNANNPGGTGSNLDDPNHQVVFAPWLSSGANGVPTGQTGFVGNQGSLISSNPPPPVNGGTNSGNNGGSPDLLSLLHQQIVRAMILAQGFQGDLSGAQQQLSGWVALASRQSLSNAAALVFDEITLTANGVLALAEFTVGIRNETLLGPLEQLQSAVDANPLTPTQAGQQIITLTSALVVANLQ